MPNISIIIATYNSGRTVRAALKSVYDQSFQDWECIVVDGASKDDTLEIVKEFCDRDSRFRYISEKDHGIYDAFNKGWKMAKSPWVHYLGSDDRLTENGLADLISECEGGDLIVGNTFIVKPGGMITKQEARGRRGCHQSMITRKSVIKTLNGFDEQYKIVADADLNIRLQEAGYRIKNVDSYVSFFSLGGVSQTIKNIWKKTRELYLLYRRHHCCKYPFLKCSRMFMVSLLVEIYRQLRYRIIALTSSRNTK